MCRKHGHFRPQSKLFDPKVVRKQDLKNRGSENAGKIWKLLLQSEASPQEIYFDNLQVLSEALETPG